MIDHGEGDDDSDEEEQTAGDSCKQYISPSEHPAADRSKNSKYSELRGG